MKLETWSLMFLGAALFYVAANIQAGWLFILDFAFLAFCFWAWVFPRIWIRGRIGVERRSPKVFEGETFSVFLRVANFTEKPKYFFLLEDRFPASEFPQDFPVFIPVLGGGETREVSYRAKAEKRGVYQAEAPVLRSIGPGAFFQWRRRIPGGGAALTVYPRPHSFAYSFRNLEPFPQSRGEGIPFGKGEEEEFFGIREYQPGDPARSLHWPSTAKTGTLMTRETGKIPPGRYLLYLDGCRQAPPRFFEDMIRFAAFFIQEILKRGDRAAFFHSGKEADKDWWESLEILAAVKPDEESPLPEQIKRNLPGFLSENSLFFFTVSPSRFSVNAWTVVKTLQEGGVKTHFIVVEGENRESAGRLRSYLVSQGSECALVSASAV